jgi:hypothetical protein
MKVLIEKCPHPKCGAKMQRLYIRDSGSFVPCAWICTDCGQFKKDNWGYGIIPDVHGSAKRMV